MFTIRTNAHSHLITPLTNQDSTKSQNLTSSLEDLSRTRLFEGSLFANNNRDEISPRDCQNINNLQKQMSEVDDSTIYSWSQTSSPVNQNSSPLRCFNSDTSIKERSSGMLSPERDSRCSLNLAFSPDSDILSQNKSNQKNNQIDEDKNWSSIRDLVDAEEELHSIWGKNKQNTVNRVVVKPVIIQNQQQSQNIQRSRTLDPKTQLKSVISSQQKNMNTDEQIKSLYQIKQNPDYSNQDDKIINKSIPERPQNPYLKNLKINDEDSSFQSQLLVYQEKDERDNETNIRVPFKNETSQQQLKSSFDSSKLIFQHQDRILESQKMSSDQLSSDNELAFLNSYLIPYCNYYPYYFPSQNFILPSQEIYQPDPYEYNSLHYQQPDCLSNNIESNLIQQEDKDIFTFNQCNNEFYSTQSPTFKNHYSHVNNIQHFYQQPYYLIQQQS